MTRHDTRATMACLLWILTFCPVLAVAEPKTWKDYSAAGKSAYQQGRYTEAEKLFEAALKEAEGFGPQDPRLATSLNNLALLYRDQGKYAEAEPLCKRALVIREQALGPDHVDVATSLNNLAGLYSAQGEYAEAEPLFKRALAIQEKALGLEHPDVAATMENYAALLSKTKREAEAAQVEANARRIRAMHSVQNPLR